MIGPHMIVAAAPPEIFSVSGQPWDALVIGSTGALIGLILIWLALERSVKLRRWYYSGQPQERGEHAAFH
jgi:hypothetical protein